MLDRLIFLQYVEHPSMVDRHPAVIDRGRQLSSPGSLFFQHSWKIRSGSLAAEFSGIRRWRPRDYLGTIPLVAPPIIAGSSRRVNSASHAWSGPLR
jgi:hypothetical protein